MTSRPRTDGKLPLTELADMKSRGEPIVMVTAYDYPSGRIADAAGDPDVNEKLSQDRADAISKYIEAKGKLKPNRIESRGYGSTVPLREERTEEDMRTNRRVEFRLVKPETEQKQAKEAGGWN